MPQLTVIVDESSEKIIRESAQKERVSLSHYLNDLIQRGLLLEGSSEQLESFLKQPKLLSVHKKLLTFMLENLLLTQYLVNNLGDEQFKKTNQHMLEKAHAHAASYVAGLFEE